MLGMPRIKIEFEFDMVFCFGIRLALFAVFFFFFFCFVVVVVVVFCCCFFVLWFLLCSVFSFGFTFNKLHDLLKVIVL